MEEPTNSEDLPMRFLRLPAVMEMTDMPRTTLLAKVRAGKFPAPVKDGPKYTAWPLHEVVAWMREKMAQRTQKADG
jgi:prophage regulatory protein